MALKSKKSQLSHLQYKEVESLYKLIQKYSLRSEAYKGLLSFYIQRQSSKSKKS